MLPRVSILPPFVTTAFNSLRLAVPDQGFHNPGNWLAPKFQPSHFTTELFDDYSYRLTLPMPVTAKAPPIRPSRPKPRPKPTATTLKPTTKTEHTIKIAEAVSNDFEQVLDKIDKSLVWDKFEDPR